MTLTTSLLMYCIPMRAFVLRCINQYTKFEVRSFTNIITKICLGQNLNKTGHVTLTTLFLGVHG